MIRVSNSSFGSLEREYVLDCLTRNWISQGYYVSRFEEEFAARHGAKYGIACSSGTAALHLAMLSLGVSSKDTVVIPTLTYIATANAARYCGARVVFADVRSDDWCLDWNSVDRVCNRYSAAPVVIPVHLFDSLVNYGSKPRLIIRVDDACHAHGSCILPNGAVSAVFSFYASKVISTGEGGMLITNDEDVNRLARLYRGQGAEVPGKYEHSVIGCNYRMTDLQAAVGLAQLIRIDQFLALRRHASDRYRFNLRGQSVTLQQGTKSSAWTMPVVLPEGLNRDGIAARLLDKGIETRPFFMPVHLQKPYKSDVILPVAESVASRGLCLPLYVGMTSDQVDYVCEQLVAAIATHEVCV